VTFAEMESALRERLEALPLTARAKLIHVLRLPDFDRADAIGTFWGNPETRTFGELLIDLEEDRYAKAMIWGLLKEMVQAAPRAQHPQPYRPLPCLEH
jgi:hypothetical protein